MGVFVAHLGVFMLLEKFKPRPKIAPPERPNFSERATVVTDEKTGETTTYREITVSTKFAPSASTPPPLKPRLPEIKPDDSAPDRE